MFGHLKSDKTLSENKQILNLANSSMKDIRIYYKGRNYLRSKTTTENTIELSLFLMRSFIFVKKKKVQLSELAITLLLWSAVFYLRHMYLHHPWLQSLSVKKKPNIPVCNLFEWDRGSSSEQTWCPHCLNSPHYIVGSG